jgi:hypothetical protein
MATISERLADNAAFNAAMLPPPGTAVPSAVFSKNFVILRLLNNG